MKLAHFLPYYPAPCGTTKSVGGMANGVARAGHDVEIWTYRTEKPSGPRHLAKVRSFSPPRQFRWLPSAELRAFIASHARDYDLIGIHGIFNPLLPLTAWLLKRAGARFIACQHGSYHPALMRKDHGRKRLYMPIEKYALRRCAAVQVPATNDVSFLRERNIRCPIIIVPNGFDAEDAPAQPRRAPSSGVPRLLFLGRLEMYVKGLDLLLEALVKLRANGGRQVTLDCVGPDWRGDVAKLQRLAAKLGLNSQVRFPGPDYQHPPHEIMSAYDLLVLPSRSEGFGFVVLEAMVNALPVIVTSETGAAEHVRACNSGWVVPATSDGLASGLAAALKAEDTWPEMGQRGRDYAFAHLQWDEIGRRAAANYERLLNRTAQPAMVYV